VSNRHEDAKLLRAGSTVCLRDRVETDLEAYLRWMATGEWLHWDAPWEDRLDVTSPDGEARFREWFLSRVQGPQPIPRTYAVIATHDGRPLGWVNRYERKRPSDWCVGIDICEDSQLNRGRGTEALTLWIDYLFDVSQVDRIALETWSFNHRMVRVAEKAGFSHEGTEHRARKWRGEWLDKLQFAVSRRTRQTKQGETT